MEKVCNAFGPDGRWRHVSRCISCLVERSFTSTLDGFAVLKARFVTSHDVKTSSLNQSVHILGM